MKISCIQMDIIHNSAIENLKKARMLIKKSLKDKPDTVVLPEMWNVGFAPGKTDISQCDKDGERVKTEIGSLAKEYNINIVAGSTANIKNGKLYNTAYVFNRSGECIAEYDKTHLFSPMNENKYFEKGSDTVCFNLDGKACTLIICYDLRFPELIRTVTTKQQTDYLFIVSAWPKSRISHLITLACARAIENQVFTACCNSCGVINKTRFGGNSMIITPLGEILASAKENETIISAECNENILSGIKKTINVFADRRTDLYKIT